MQDISKVSVNGLGSVEYIDKVLDATTHSQTDPTLKFSGEVDRVYKDIKLDTTSILEDGKPRFDITRDNVKDTVTWNPWIEKSKGMSDFEPKDGYKSMIAVEVGTVQGFQNLLPGETFEGGMIAKAKH